MVEFSDKTWQQTICALKVGEDGLSDEEAARRIKNYGANVIEQHRQSSLVALFFSQFKDVMTILLIVAAAISAVVAYLSGEVSDLTDTIIILAIIALNAVVGTVQQYRADKAIENLKKLSQTTAKVKRGGQTKVIGGDCVTVGDVICLEEGDLVPADCRIISCDGLKLDESALTGESQGVEKSSELLQGGAQHLSQAKNMAFKGTFVVGGGGTAVVVGIGRHTQIGAIADMLDDSDRVKTPLEKSLDKLGKIISAFVLAVAALIFIMGALVRGEGILKNFMTAIAVAVAAIPESLPAVVTIIMALGVQRMSSQNVLIRKLKSVEALGSCSCICTDKTGTLTQNKMKVTSAYCSFAPLSTAHSMGVIAIFASCAAICTRVKGDKNNYLGDPTEVALKTFADGLGFDKPYQKVGEIPFSSERKMMSVSAKCGGNTCLYCKGAPDVIIDKCTHVLTDGGVRLLTAQDKKTILAQVDQMNDDALRTLALAYREGESLQEIGLTFIGLCGMMDGLKKGIKQAVEECKCAGITTVMITGDHARTAFAIAKQAGIAQDFSQVYTGDMLDKMTKPQLKQAIKQGRVFARVSPRHKNLIVKIKQSLGEVVAMTGDGVNDAPSVKSADIGIAMGLSGTDVTKSVADMVIADDNFTTIVTAVREGRRISSNIKKTIQFFLSTNLAEVLAILVASLVFFKYNFLLPTQLLWINLITDSFPVLALGVEKGDFYAMSRPPERAEKAIFSLSSVAVIALSGAYIAGVTLGAYAFCLFAFGNDVATTVAFLTVSFAELFHAFNIRSQRLSAFSKKVPKNMALIVTVVLGVAVNVALCISPLAQFFGIATLSTAQWLLVWTVSLSVIPFCELYKLIMRLAAKHKKSK